MAEIKFTPGEVINNLVPIRSYQGGGDLTDLKEIL
jgi:hypothetical protein